MQLFHKTVIFVTQNLNCANISRCTVSRPIWSMPDQDLFLLVMCGNVLQLSSPHWFVIRIFFQISLFIPSVLFVDFTFPIRDKPLNLNFVIFLAKFIISKNNLQMNDLGTNKPIFPMCDDNCPFMSLLDYWRKRKRQMRNLYNSVFYGDGLLYIP